MVPEPPVVAGGEGVGQRGKGGRRPQLGTGDATQGDRGKLGRWNEGKHKKKRGRERLTSEERRAAATMVAGGSGLSLWEAGVCGWLEKGVREGEKAV